MDPTAALATALILVGGLTLLGVVLCLLVKSIAWVVDTDIVPSFVKFILVIFTGASLLYLGVVLLERSGFPAKVETPAPVGIESTPAPVEKGP